MHIVFIWVFFFLLLLLGMPIVFVIGVISLGYLLFIGGIPLELLPQRVFQGIDKFPLMAIPFFILAAEIMVEAKVIKSILRLADTLVGHLKGGLAHVNVVASFFFAGISGSALADAAGLGSVEVPMMLEAGYPRDFSAAITAASAIMGPIVPPSVTFIVYALVAQNVSVTALLMAGFVPGVLVAIALMLLIYFMARKKAFPLREKKPTLRELYEAIKEAFLPMLMPVILLGGLLLGIFTPTEAAAVASGYGFFIGFFVLRKLKISSLPGIFLRTAKTSSSVLWIMATANVLTWILASENLAVIATELLTSISTSPFVFLLIINVLFLLVGCLLESAAGIIIFTPLLLPLAEAMGIHPIHFGVVVVLNLMIGLLTPPVGLVLYVVSNVAQISLEDLIKEVWPFVLVELVVLLLITYIPWLVLSVPRLFGLV